MNLKFSIILFSIGTLLYGCGYLMAGSWEDDPENWNRIFGEDVPEKVTLIHSRYSRNAHWSYEAQAFLEFEADQYFLDHYFIEKYNLYETEIAMRLLVDEEPSWFIKNTEDYIEWRDKEGIFYLAKDKNSNKVFFHFLQF